MPVRQARADDHDAVAAFTEDTWSDRDVGDYIPEMFPEWVAGDGPEQRTVVATVEDTPVGVCQALLLSDTARVLVPDTPRFISDAATTRCRLGDTTEYIFAADLTDRK